MWFGLALLWVPLMWLSVLWWVALVSAAIADVQALRDGVLVTARRPVERVLSVGSANPVPVVIRNRSSRVFRALLRDEPPLDFTVERRMLERVLTPTSEASETYHVTPPRRGDFTFGPLNARFTTGFGLVVRQFKFDLSFGVQVYPNLANIRALELSARKRRLTDIGVHASRVRGTGLEFESLRAYVPGDELRRIDWKATARRDEPITREYDIERSQHIVLCLDLGRTMASELGDYTKADHAVNAAALLAHVAAKIGDWVGLYAFAQGPMLFVPPRKHQFSLVLDSLYGLQPQRMESDYYRSFLYAAQRIGKRSLVVLFTDLLDPDSSARLISYITLLTRRHLVLCAALSDYELYEMVGRSPEQPGELYERTVATALLSDRQRALSALRERGAIAVDATPRDLSTEVLNRYLAIKERARL